MRFNDGFHGKLQQQEKWIAIASRLSFRINSPSRGWPGVKMENGKKSRSLTDQTQCYMIDTFRMSTAIQWMLCLWCWPGILHLMHCEGTIVQVVQCRRDSIGISPQPRDFPSNGNCKWHSHLALTIWHWNMAKYGEFFSHILNGCSTSEIDSIVNSQCRAAIMFSFYQPSCYSLPSSAILNVYSHTHSVCATFQFWFW